MRYMDYLLENTIQAAAIHRTLSLVRVPDPARYGLHKFLVAEERPVIEETKAAKDAAQAEEVLGLLFEHRPGDVAIACEALVKRNLHQKVLRSAQRRLKGDSAVLDKNGKGAGLWGLRWGAWSDWRVMFTFEAPDVIPLALIG
jgi:hypothetical protein